jgi:hypothetical protein
MYTISAKFVRDWRLPLRRGRLADSETRSSSGTGRFTDSLGLAGAGVWCGCSSRSSSSSGKPEIRSSMS